jgi:DNA-binding transcriptional LysR family regulator
MGIEDILVFIRVADALSFKDAAKHLNISRSQASKRIAALEEELGTPLIYRSPRSISLTSAGTTLLEHYRRIFDLMEQARTAVAQLNDAPTGRLKFSMPTCLGAHLLPKLYENFLPLHPRVLLDAHVSEAAVDIVAGGYDVVIRIAQRLTDSTLTARRLATSPLALAAAPSYLLEHGTPADVSELSRHRCLGLQADKQPRATWQFRASNQRFSIPVGLSVMSDTCLSLVLAAVAGLGFIYVPKVVIAEELRRGMLQTVLPEFCLGIEWGIYAVHAGRSPSRNAAALIEFTRGVLPTLGGCDGRKPFVARPAAVEKGISAFR